MTFDEAVREVIRLRGTPPDYRHVAAADLQAAVDSDTGVGLWLRPKSWYGFALSIGWHNPGVDGRASYPCFFRRVPGGFSDQHTLMAFEVLEDWEVVSPDKVLAETLIMVVT